ncbi:MAG: exonuclease domain-containing protein [Flavipsychrobacter sp.]|nr:exonuclease domain-containing protein [Flavipsychrobacter sp.]
MLYAVVDIETTGSYAMGNGITEIAIVIHDGEKVLDFYETLVNPHRPIPWFIQNLTGITNEMVINAPAFEEVAPHIHSLLQDKVFIAHNVNFDYSFVKHHLQVCGLDLNTPKLCTVRLSRKILPGLNGYSLSKLSHQLNLSLTNHHRAGGDAMATANLFAILLNRDTENVIKGMLKGRNKEQYLPPHLPVSDLDQMPVTPGVYYFYNAAGKAIYVGKAKNLLKRVKSHFANNKPTKQKQDFLRDIHKISYKECGTDLMAHILESTEIRRLWPIYNRSQRGYLPKFGLFVYEDMNGYKRFTVEKNKQFYKPIYTFNTITEGHTRIRELVTEFGLCARLCNMGKDIDCMNGKAADTCTGTCTALINVAEYNARVTDAIDWMQKRLPSFVLVDKGIDDNEHSCILIKEGNFYGMGYITDKGWLKNIDGLEKQIEPLQDNDYVRNLIYKHATEYPEKCVSFA